MPTPTPTIPRPPKPTGKTNPTAPTVPTENLGGNGGNSGATSEPATDVPPRSRARASAGASAAAGAAGATGKTASPGGARAPRPGQLETKLGEFFGTFSLVFSAAGDDYSAWIIAERSPRLAHSWAELAKQNPAVKRVLEGLVEGSAWGGVILSTLSIALPIAKHHGIWKGPDPFTMILPGPPSEVSRPRGNDNGNGSGSGFKWSKGGETPAPQDSDDDEYMTTMPGAPPGVVTVASTNAAHSGAR